MALSAAMFGQQRTAEAYRYVERAVNAVQALIQEHQLQSDYTHPGQLRVATTPSAVRRIQHDLTILASLGVRAMGWLDAAAIRAEADSPRFLGGAWTPNCGLLNPVKHVRELRRLAELRGAQIYEHTPVQEIRRGAPFTLQTPGGTIMAEKLVVATNAYTHRLPLLRRRQIPIFTHMVVTEPLTPAQLDGIGWRNRQGIEDARNLGHYFRLTADNRLAIGGEDISLAYGTDMARSHNGRAFDALERTVVWLFPSLRGVRFTHRWGGPISLPVDLVPAIGQIGDRRALFSLGCVGHGVALTHLNGRTLADLVLERKTDLTDVWFINRRMLPWPPEPLRSALSQVVRGVLRIQDAVAERHRS